MKYIVITSIFEPTQAVIAFSKIPGYSVIVVGDKKSPENYNYDGVKFLPYTKKFGFKIESLLPYNHYCRKMIGYALAIRNGANVIIDTDDDNVPLDNWRFPDFQGNFDIVTTDTKFINMYELYTEQKIWPRGMPLQYINQKNNYKIFKEKCEVGIWQSLADADPDVDAIYRLTNNTPCFFDKSIPEYILNKDIFCPFNSQNTAFRKELFALLYLPTTVTFRFTDILRGLVAQPIMQLYGYRLGFTTSTVIQERNEHDYIKDFEDEIPCYLHSESVIEIVKEVVHKDFSVNNNLMRAYAALSERNIINNSELNIVNAWLEDIGG